MAILIDGEMMEAGEKPQLEEVVETSADPKQTGGAATRTDNTLMEAYLRGFQKSISTIQGRDGVNLKQPQHKKWIRTTTPWLCFREGLIFAYKEITRDNFIQMVEKLDSQLGKLLTITDLNNLIPEQIQLSSVTSYEKLPSNLQSRIKVAVQSVKTLLDCSKAVKVIPDWESLSLFLSHGEKLRDVVLQSGMSPDQIPFAKYSAYGRETVILNFPEIGAKELISYVESSGDGNITEMLTEYDNFRFKCQSLKDYPNKVVDFLYDQLKKNHPELTI